MMHLKELTIPVCRLGLKNLEEMSNSPMSEAVDLEEDEKYQSIPKDNYFPRNSRSPRKLVGNSGSTKLVKVLGVHSMSSSSDDEDKIKDVKNEYYSSNEENEMEDKKNKEDVALRRSSRRKTRFVEPKYKESLTDDKSDTDEDWNENDDDDSDTDQGITQDHSYELNVRGVGRPRKTDRGRPRKTEKTRIKVEEKSEYEEMIEKQRAERMAFLQSLKMNEAKSDLIEAIGAVKQKKIQPVKRIFKRKENTSPPVLRKSRRIAKLDTDLSEDALYRRAIIEAQETERKKVIPPEFPFKEALQFEELYEGFVEDVSVQDSSTESKSFSYNGQILKKLNLEDSNIAKVTPDRITSLAWHPSADTLIVAAGSKYGNLGIWNVDSESSPYVFKNHLEGTTNLQFNPWNPVELVSSSHDGTLRSGNMVKHIFSEIYNVAEESSCTYFDFLSATTFLVGQRNGIVALVDNRTEGKRCQKKHPCHDYSVKTVSSHPVNKNYFLTAENKGSIRLWDLRKLQKTPVVDITHHKRCVHSAFFSRVTGNHVLTTSVDDTVCIFDSTSLTNDIPLKHLMKHNNQTGRWLSVFRAMWLPNSDEAFVIGSMQYPRRIQVFNSKMNVEHVLIHENLTTVTSLNTFHPFKPALAAANSSGKVVIFT